MTDLVLLNSKIVEKVLSMLLSPTDGGTATETNDLPKLFHLYCNLIC